MGIKGFAMLGIGKVGIIEKDHLEEVTTGKKLEMGPLDAIIRPLAVAPLIFTLAMKVV